MNAPDSVSEAQVNNAFDKAFESLFVDDDKDDEWARVDPDPSVGGESAIHQSSTQDRLGAVLPSVIHPAANHLPVVDTLARPNTLFATTSPYILTVSVFEKDYIRVDCSHQASLEVLAAYLQRWSKINVHDSERVWLYTGTHIIQPAKTMFSASYVHRSTVRLRLMFRHYRLPEYRSDIEVL